MSDLEMRLAEQMKVDAAVWRKARALQEAGQSSDPDDSDVKAEQKRREWQERKTERPRYATPEEKRDARNARRRAKTEARRRARHGNRLGGTQNGAAVRYLAPAKGSVTVGTYARQRASKRLGGSKREQKPVTAAKNG